ncbi:sugar-binding domain-containing protein [Actinobaculum sp. 352]|uniref:sugar-binding transcriptional regulator n=1 Tax=Actinobaculum sp. 352 TaxID=2490946 RepID=UPI0019D308D4|nr:sugar-binding domain-containing protein [Actinobaculum sp. 352]
MCASIAMARQRRRLELLLKVATRYWVDGASQADIARELGYSRPQISRLLQEARERGVVRISVQHPLSRAVEAEEQLVSRFNLAGAHVAFADDADPQSTAPVLSLGAELLLSMLKPDSVVAVTNGRAVAGVVAALPTSRHHEVTVVQAIGAIARDNHMVDSPDLCRRLAAVLGGNYRILPAPLYVNDSHAASALRRESTISLTISMASHADIILTGIGATTRAGAGAIFDLWYGSAEIAELLRMGAVGHIGGHHFNASGQHTDGNLCRRLLGVPFDRIRDSSDVIAVAWGEEKVPAILGALRGGLVSHLVTDMRTANAVLALDDAA